MIKVYTKSVDAKTKAIQMYLDLAEKEHELIVLDEDEIVDELYRGYELPLLVEGDNVLMSGYGSEQLAKTIQEM